MTLMMVCTMPFQKERELTAARFFRRAQPNSRIPHSIMYDLLTKMQTAGSKFWPHCEKLLVKG